MGNIALATIPLKDKPHYYFRHKGFCTEVPRTHFAEFMSSFLTDNSAIAGKLRSKTPNYQFINTAAIVAEHNRAQAETSNH